MGNRSGSNTIFPSFRSCQRLDTAGTNQPNSSQPSPQSPSARAHGLPRVLSTFYLALNFQINSIKANNDECDCVPCICFNKSIPILLAQDRGLNCAQFFTQQRFVRCPFDCAVLLCLRVRSVCLRRTQHRSGVGSLRANTKAFHVFFLHSTKRRQ